MIRMKQKTKHALTLAAVILAMGLLGYMDEQDAQCSWNGCGEDRFTQQGE